MNNPSSFDSMPVLLNTNIAHPTEYKGAYPHSEVWDSGQRSCGGYVKFKYIGHVFW